MPPKLVGRRRPLVRGRSAMKPVDRNGNCLQACVATIFEVPIETVVHDWSDEWFARLTEWSIEHLGHYPMLLDAKSVTVDLMPDEALCILGGLSPRGPWPHYVVGRGGGMEVAHDPHSSRAGLKSVTGVMVFVPVTPTARGERDAAVPAVELARALTATKGGRQLLSRAGCIPERLDAEVAEHEAEERAARGAEREGGDRG